MNCFLTKGSQLWSDRLKWLNIFISLESYILPKYRFKIIILLLYKQVVNMCVNLVKKISIQLTYPL